MRSNYQIKLFYSELCRCFLLIIVISVTDIISGKIQYIFLWNYKTEIFFYCKKYINLLLYLIMDTTNMKNDTLRNKNVYPSIIIPL